jgi:hypothetical protein
VNSHFRSFSRGRREYESWELAQRFIDLDNSSLYVLIDCLEELQLVDYLRNRFS